MKIMTTRHELLAAAAALLALATTLPAQAEKAKHTGQASWYTYTGNGNCVLPPPDDMLTAAINAQDYQGAKACGGYVQVKNTATGAVVKVRIDDQCPTCGPGNLDLSSEAFGKIADLGQGIVPITWKYIPYNQPSMQLFFANGSSPYYTAVQVRDHRYRLDKLQYRATGSGDDWRVLERQDYNYFVKADGMGPGPYDFRLTDVNKQVVVVKNVPLQINVELDTGKQFPKYTAP